MTPRERIRLLREAHALEQVGGTWTQQHAAVVCGYSVATFRLKDCPREYEPGEGVHGKARLVYVPEAVRAWKQAIRQSA